MVTGLDDGLFDGLSVVGFESVTGLDDGFLEGGESVTRLEVGLVDGALLGLFEGDRLGLDVGYVSDVEIESRNIMCVS